MVQIGDVIRFVDPLSKEHNALITAVHENNEFPSINLVYVSDDENAHDQYGRQLAERQTSIVHESSQGARGFFWRKVESP